MSTNLACLLFGIPATLVWMRAVKRGVIFGSKSHWVRRDEDPLVFWFFAILYGGIAMGLVVMPIFAWLGLREGD